MKTLLTTRALADAIDDIAFLEAKGLSAIAAPMLEIHPVEIDPAPLTENYDTIAFTSRNAPSRLMAAAETFRDIPSFCVGEATAAAASEAGFTNIITNDGGDGPADGAALAARIISAKPKPRHLLWASGIHFSFDLETALEAGGITATRLPVYEARKTAAMPGAALTALKAGEVGAVLVHSGRAAENLASLMKKHAISNAGIDLIAVSRGVAGLCGGGWHTITIAATTSRAAMLEAAIEKAGMP